MIHFPTFMYVTKPINTSGHWDKVDMLEPGPEFKKVLENTSDHVVWIITAQQLPDFRKFIVKYGLDQYLVIDHDDNGDWPPTKGTSNRNYPQHNNVRRLKVFIMKGAK